MNTHQASYGEVIRNRNFRLLWLASSISLLGDWFNTITLYALVTKLTGSPLAVGLVEFLKLGGYAAASIPGGILADRIDRRRLMIATDLLRAAIVPFYLLIDSAEHVPFLYLLILAQIGLGAVFDPAYRALLPNLVSTRELVTANAILSATWSTILAIGASVGGLVGVWLGSDAVFVIDAFTYVVSASCLFAMRLALVPMVRAPLALGRPRPSIFSTAWADLREGLRYLFSHREVLRLSLAKTAWALGGSALVYFLTQLGPKLTPEDAALGIGILYSARGLGTGIGPILARQIRDRRIWMLVTGLAITASGVFYLGVGGLGVSYWVLVPIVIAHAASGANWVLSTVMLQERVPDHMRGRVFAAELMVLTAVEAVVVLAAAGMLETGAVTLTLAFVLFSLVQIASGLAYLRWTRRDLAAVVEPQPAG
ncbi:MAG TPA: MFS transporter [Myxococcota bacterium]|nr:MFS transporter [Myxococcota bacterium]